MTPSPTSLDLAKQLAATLVDRPRILRKALEIVADLEPCRHGPGFASVNWHGREFSFSGAKARAVEILWEAWENGTPEVRQDHILDQVGSVMAEEDDGRGRLADLFKGHDAWMALIVPGKSRGSFRLRDGPIPEKL